MWPGLWVSSRDGRACMATACGVTPHAQKTGTSPRRISTGSPKSGRSNVGDTDGRRIADMDRRSVGQRKALADARRGLGLRWRQRPHRHDHRPREDARRTASDVGAVHRHVAALLDVPHRDAGLHQRVLEGERTAQQETDEIVAPPAEQVGRLLDQFAVAIDAVARHIGAKVGAGGGVARFGTAGIGDVEQRTRLRIALAEQQKIESEVARHNDEVGLHVAQSEARRRSRQFAAAGLPSDLGPGRFVQVNHCSLSSSSPIRRSGSA